MERASVRLALMTVLCPCVALSLKKVNKGVRIFVPPSLSLIVENLTLRVFEITNFENLNQYHDMCVKVCVSIRRNPRSSDTTVGWMI